MKDDETDWFALQVPDGTDWIEYMLNQPEHADLQLTGVMNHISLGVSDMKKAQAIWNRVTGRLTATKSADGQRWQVAVEPIRSRSGARGINGIQARAKTLLLRVHRAPSLE